MRLLTGAPAGRPLPLLYFVDDEETPTLRITAFVLKHRAGGFMVALPGLLEVTELLTNLALGSPEAPLLFTEATVACETPRRRAVGDVGLVLADVPWHWLGFFRRGASLRNSELRLLSITSAGAVVRPVLGPALAAADSWVASAQGEPDMQDSMGEYATAAEDGEDLGPEDEGLDTPDMEIAGLRAQVASLERAALTQPPADGGRPGGRATGTQARRGSFRKPGLRASRLGIGIDFVPRLGPLRLALLNTNVLLGLWAPRRRTICWPSSTPTPFRKMPLEVVPPTRSSTSCS